MKIIILVIFLIVLILTLYILFNKEQRLSKIKLSFPEYTGCEKFFKYDIDKIPDFNINGMDINKNIDSLSIYFDPINKIWLLVDNKTGLFEIEDTVIVNIEGVNYYGTVKKKEGNIIHSINIPGTDKMKFECLNMMLKGKVIFKSIKNN